MARTTAHPPASRQVGIENRRLQCAACGGQTPVHYRARRKVVTLDGVVALKVQVRVCHREGCALRLKAIRAEEECLWVLPEHELGLDVIALIGALRNHEHRSVPAIHAALRARNVPISERSVTNMLGRYHELLALRLEDCPRLKAVMQKWGRVVLSINALRSGVGSEVLWVARDCLSSEVLGAWSLPEHRTEDLAQCLQEMLQALEVPVVGVVSEAQGSVVNAVAIALPGVPHQLRQPHERADTSRPLPEASLEPRKALAEPAYGTCAAGLAFPGAQTEHGVCFSLTMAFVLSGDVLLKFLPFSTACAPIGL
jgi:hypothetical protein